MAHKPTSHLTRNLSQVSAFPAIGGGGPSRSRHSSYNFTSSRLTQSYDVQQLNYDFIYNSWDTLSAGIADKIRSGSVRVDRSNQFPPIEEGKEQHLPYPTEKSPLLLDSSSKQSSLQEDDPLLGGSSIRISGIGWLSVAFGLANASIGVGILNFPFIYNRVGGIELSTILQLAMIFGLFLSMSILIYCSDIHDSCSYHEVMSSICGPRAKILVAADIAIATYGICIAYLVIIGDQYDRMFASLIGPDFCRHWFLERKFTIAITSLIIYPICLLKRLDFLRHTGPLGIFAMLYVVFLTAYDYFTHREDVSIGGNQTTQHSQFNSSLTSPDTPIAPEKTVFQILSCIPVMLFGYQCNEVIVPIYASLKERRIGNFLKAAFLAYGFLILLYCTVGSLGYITYGSTVTENVMLMFNAKDPLVLLGVCALIFKMIVTYPQMAFAGREAYTGIVKEYSNDSSQVFHRSDSMRRFRVSTTWFLSSVILAAFAPHIGIVLEVLGTLASFNVFICPALCLIFLSRRKDTSYKPLTRILMVLFAVLFIAIGIGFFIVVVIQVYWDVKEVIEQGSASLCSV